MKTTNTPRAKDPQTDPPYNPIITKCSTLYRKLAHNPIMTQCSSTLQRRLAYNFIMTKFSTLFFSHTVEKASFYKEMFPKLESSDTSSSPQPLKPFSCDNKGQGLVTRVVTVLSRLNEIPLFGDTLLCLSIYPLVNI